MQSCRLMSGYDRATLHRYIPSTNKIYLFHHLCIDGYTCRYLINENLGSLILRKGEPINLESYAFLHPAPYDLIEKILETADPNAGLIIADYAFPIEAIRGFCKIFSWVVLCDHHPESNQEILAAKGSWPPNFFHYFDPALSGAQVTGQFLRALLGDIVYPQDMVDAISDLDCGHIEKPDYDPISCAMGTMFDMTSDIRAMTTLRVLSRKKREEIAAKGEVLIPIFRQTALAQLASPSFLWFQGTPHIPPCYVPIIFGDILAPQGGRMLADMACEAARRYDSQLFVIWNKRKDQRTQKEIVHFSVRAPQNGPNASEFANAIGSRYINDRVNGLGGKGHPERAAFQCWFEHMDLLYPRYSNEFRLLHPDGPPLDKARRYDHRVQPHYQNFLLWLCRRAKRTTNGKPPRHIPIPHAPAEYPAYIVH